MSLKQELLGVETTEVVGLTKMDKAGVTLGMDHLGGNPMVIMQAAEQG